jgi:DNA-binding protein YbaB
VTVFDMVAWSIVSMGVTLVDMLGGGFADGGATWLVDDWEAGLATRAAAAQRLAERVAELTVSASGADGTVEVTVAGSGVPTDIRLGDRVLDWSPDRIAAEILATMRRAQGLLAARVADVATETVGADSESARAVISGFELRFPVRSADDDAGRDGVDRDRR